MPMLPRFSKKRWGLIVGAVIVLAVALRMCSSGNAERAFLWDIRHEVRLAPGSVMLHITTTGEVKPQNRLEVKPPIAGRIEEIFVEEGQEVARGDLLAKMSSTERAALLDSARSKGEEKLKYWEEAYRPTPLLAPIDGTVIVRGVEPGQTVTTGDDVVVISDRLIVDALVNETDIGKIEIGQPATVVLDAYPDRTFSGVVDHIAFESELEQNVNIYHVEVAPDEVDPIFRSGMTVQVSIKAGDRQNVLILPQEAIYPCPSELASASGASCVARGLKNGEPVWQEVKVGLSNGLEAEILGGLEEGDTVTVLRKKKNVEREKGNPFSPFGSRKRRKS